MNKNEMVVILQSVKKPELYFSKFVQDNSASYTFTTSDLNSFAPNEEVRLFVARGTEQTYTQGNRTLAIRIGNLITCASMTIR